MAAKSTVQLKASQRRMLLRIARTGKHHAREILRANIVLKSADGWTDEQIADAFNTSADTVRRTRVRWCREGATEALSERARPGQPPRLTNAEEQLLIALACSQPPKGRQRWTVRLLTEEAIGRGFIREVAPETVRQVLQKTRSSRGKWRVGATPTSMTPTSPA
jgi:transposase